MSKIFIYMLIESSLYQSSSLHLCLKNCQVPFFFWFPNMIQIHFKLGGNESCALCAFRREQNVMTKRTHGKKKTMPFHRRPKPSRGRQPAWPGSYLWLCRSVGWCQMKPESLLEELDTKAAILVFWKGRYCLTPELCSGKEKESVDRKAGRKRRGREEIK